MASATHMGIRCLLVFVMATIIFFVGVVLQGCGEEVSRADKEGAELLKKAKKVFPEVFLLRTPADFDYHGFKRLSISGQVVAVVRQARKARILIDESHSRIFNDDEHSVVEVLDPVTKMLSIKGSPDPSHGRAKVFIEFEDALTSIQVKDGAEVWVDQVWYSVAAENRSRLSVGFAHEAIIFGKNSIIDIGAATTVQLMCKNHGVVTVGTLSSKDQGRPISLIAHDYGTIIIKDNQARHGSQRCSSNGRLEIAGEKMIGSNNGCLQQGASLASLTTQSTHDHIAMSVRQDSLLNLTTQLSDDPTLMYNNGQQSAMSGIRIFTKDKAVKRRNILVPQFIMDRKFQEEGA